MWDIIGLQTPSTIDVGYYRVTNRSHKSRMLSGYKPLQQFEIDVSDIFEFPFGVVRHWKTPHDSLSMDAIFFRVGVVPSPFGVADPKRLPTAHHRDFERLLWL